ncbi:MAG: hypothetical protein GEU80_09170 [Dehalococcoidia bacterium]|nr:hypothetical protein [Dehalococcoidia bacterium]
MERAFPWLDAQNNDDRIVATAFEISRVNARTPVILVTRDLNLQNKMAYAAMPFAEPPEPPQAPNR